MFAEAFSMEVSKMSSPSSPPPAQNVKKPPIMTASPEEQVRDAVTTCIEYWCSTADKVHSAVPKVIYKDCSVVSLVDGAATSCEGGNEFSLGFGDNDPLSSSPSPQNQNQKFKIVSIKILPVGAQNAAVVNIRITTTESNIQYGWLTLLRTASCMVHGSTKTGYWTCISAAFSNAPSNQINPDHFADVAKLAWDGYGQSNRDCNGAGMAQVFHPTCRLTYAQNETIEEGSDGIVVFPQPTFLDKVQRRYEKTANANENMHAPYAELQDHHDIGRYDALLGIEFVTQNLCLVTLRVGHPPCLWTDVLTCCKLEGNNKSESRWWIMHKSSCMEPYELTEDMQAILNETINLQM